MEKFKLPNWREFLTQVGTIVLGVSLALAAEQAAAAWNQHRQYLDARAAVRGELEINIANIQRRGNFTACIRARLDAIGALLDDAENHEAIIAPSWIGPAQTLRVRFSSEPDVGNSSLFSTAEARGYSRVYSYVHTYEAEQERERLAWARLRLVEGRTRLSPEMIYGLQVALADARSAYERIDFLSTGTRAIARQAGLSASPAAQRYIAEAYYVIQWPHCVPMNTPRAEAERLSAGHWGNPEAAQ